MKGFLVVFGLPVVAVLIFISGSLPYTLVYDDKTLAEVNFAGEKPVTAEVVKCEMRNADHLNIGDLMETTFRAKLRNNTDRFVVVSAMGEVISPKGLSGGINSQLMILNPNAVEETSFRTTTVYASRGRYRCEMRYTIGRFK